MKKDTSIVIAEKLLQIKAIKLEPANPFTWASGLKSPIYCDNRKTLSFPEVRDSIRDSFCEMIKDKFSNADMIAGVATGAIAHGVLVAETLNLPFVYIRSNPKGHGLENLIEGDLSQGKNIVVIEDLISTGGSSLKAVEALRQKKVNVLGLIAIFSYEFDNAIEAFKNAGCQFFTLSNYSFLLKAALEMNYVSLADLQILKNWRENPEQWSAKFH